MFRRRSRAEREWRAAQRAGQALLALHADEPWPVIPAPATAPTSAVGQSAGSGFLPPDLQVPALQDVDGFMFRRIPPIVIDGEIRQCYGCGAYRDWIVFNLRDGSIWLRCRCGHQSKEPRLDSAWYNRNSGPMERYHVTFEDGLRHLGH